MRRLVSAVAALFVLVAVGVPQASGAVVWRPFTADSPWNRVVL